MSKFKNTEELEKAYKQLEEEFKNKGRPNTIEDNNVDYDNCNIYAMRQKIKDLETKLAESEKKAYSRGHSQRDIANEIKLNALREDVANKEKRIVELKQQLAEKDEQLNSAQVGEEFALKCCDEANKLLALQVTGQHQDKISFAVEQLENFLKTIHSHEKIYLSLNDFKIINEIFDNQIKAIKGEK